MSSGYKLDEIRGILRRRCDEAGSQNAWARQHGLAQQYVSEVARGTRPPSERVLSALGLEKVVVYRLKTWPWSDHQGLTDERVLCNLSRALVLRDEQAVTGWRRALAERAFQAHWSAEEIYRSAHEGFPSEQGVAEASGLYARAETLREVEGVEELFKEFLDEAERDEAYDAEHDE